MDDNLNLDIAFPRYVRNIIFVMTCMELKLFEVTRNYFSENEERSLGISVILITFFISSLNIFNIIPFVSFVLKENNNEFVFFILCLIGICFILWGFNDIFLALSVYISHGFLVLSFSRLLIFPLIYPYERTLQIGLGYLWWLAFSYFHRYAILFMFRKKMNYETFIGCMIILIYLTPFISILIKR